jgi:hypothetical protein
MRMHKVLRSPEDRERAIQIVLHHLVLPDIAEHVRRLSMPPEEYVRRKLRRATVDILSGDA